MTAGSPAAPSSRSYAPEETVTGEGVALELPVASLGMRALSGMIDVIFHIGLLIGVFTLTGALTEESSEAVSRTGIIVSFVGVLVGVPTVSETLSRGKTLGKLITGMRVVRDDGGPVSFRHSLTRALVGWVEIYLLTGIGAAISGLVTARTKRLGDLAAGTYVIAERSRIQLPPPPSAPPELAGWARTADIASLEPDVAVAVRQFLPRANLLSDPRVARRTAIQGEIGWHQPFSDPRPSVLRDSSSSRIASSSRPEERTCSLARIRAPRALPAASASRIARCWRRFSS